jgi:CHASE2 domain-containing sensor protein
MPYVGSSDAPTQENTDLPDYLNKFTLKKIPESNLPSASSIFPPIELLSNQVGGIGVISAYSNTLAHAHHEPLILQYGDVYLPSFALMMTARNLGLSASHITADSNQTLKLGSKVLNTDGNFFSYPRYYQGENNQPAFRTYSFIDLLSGEIPSSELRRKTILIGLTSTQHVATQMTPIGVAMTPTMIAAHSISSLLNDETFQVPKWAPWAQKVSIVIIGLYLILVLPRLRKTTAFFVSVFLLLIMTNAHFIFMSSEATW